MVILWFTSVVSILCMRSFAGSLILSHNGVSICKFYDYLMNSFIVGAQYRVKCYINVCKNTIVIFLPFAKESITFNQFLPVLVLCKLHLAVYLESRRMEVYRLIGHEVVLRLTRRHQASRTVSAGSLPAPWSVDTQHDLHDREHL